MTETNTVWYVKTQGCSYLCKQHRERREFRAWGEDSWNIKWKLVDFQYGRLQQLGTDAGYTSAATGLLENIWAGERDGAPEGQHRRDWHRHRQNVSQHLKQSNSNMRFRIHKHVSVLLFMRKLAFTRTWHSRRLTFLRPSVRAGGQVFLGSPSDPNAILLLTGKMCSLSHKISCLQSRFHPLKLALQKEQFCRRICSLLLLPHYAAYLKCFFNNDVLISNNYLFYYAFLW